MPHLINQIKIGTQSKYHEKFWYPGKNTSAPVTGIKNDWSLLSCVENHHKTTTTTTDRELVWIWNAIVNKHQNTIDALLAKTNKIPDKNRIYFVFLMFSMSLLISWEMATMSFVVPVFPLTLLLALAHGSDPNFKNIFQQTTTEVQNQILNNSSGSVPAWIDGDFVRQNCASFGNIDGKVAI